MLLVDRNRQEWRLGALPQDAVSRVIPREFEEVCIRVFTKNSHQVKVVRSAFNKVGTLTVKNYCFLVLYLAIRNFLSYSGVRITKSARRP